MRRYEYKKYLIVGALLLLLLACPNLFVERLRAKTFAAFSWIFKGTSRLVKRQISEEARLEAENHLLRIEIGKLRALLDQKAKVHQLDEETKKYALSSQHLEEMNLLGASMCQAVPAHVVYRDPSNGSSAWVNVGEETNKILKRSIIQKNSPVIIGRSLIGVIDHIGKTHSRVRLITDTALKPSVRATRGLPQNLALIEHIEPIVRHLQVRSDSVLTPDERTFLLKQLEKLRDYLSLDCEGWYLAKGILQGSVLPLARSVGQTVHGIGFNYDFADHEGPARELLTGAPINTQAACASLPILKVNDLLVTTGMDGVFPPGLRVAEVTKIYPLREGAYTYELEATLVVGLDTVHTVFIIPPLGFEQDESRKS